MSNLLIVGKDLPEGLELAESFITTRKVFSIAKTEAEELNFESENILASTWNKASAISSRALIIKAETQLERLNQYLIYFDAPYFNSIFELDRTETISQAVDTMILSYQYFLNELINRLEQRKEDATVFFFIKKALSKIEAIQQGNKNTIIHPASNIVNTAQNAFIASAENFSTLVSDKPYLSVLLGKCEPNNELYNSDKQIGNWIKQGFDTIESSKNKQTVKQACNWIKAGSKISTGFNLFR